MRDRESTPPLDNENEEKSEGRGGDKNQEEQGRVRYLAELRAEGERREWEAKTAVEAARAAARAAAPGETSGEGFNLAGEKKIGSKAFIGVETNGGGVKTITEVLGIGREKAARISFVYGDSLRVTIKKENIGGRETETATVTVPINLIKAGFPFLVRETVRALGVLETHEVEERKGKKGGQTMKVDEPTVEARIIRAELDKQKKFEDGWNEIQKTFTDGDTHFSVLRKRYKELETDHSQAQCHAEAMLNRLMEERARTFKEATGVGLYDSYGSAEAFNQELLRRTMEQQAKLVFPYDDKRANLLLLGRPAVGVEKMQNITFTGLWTGLWGPYWARRAYHGRHWDVPFVDRFKPILRDSTTVTDYMLRRKLHDNAQGSKGADIAVTFGKTALVDMAGGLAILGLAAGAELPLRAIGGGLNWLDKKLYNWQKKLGGWFSKDYKPGQKILAEKEEERKKAFDNLAKKALGQQEEKSNK